MPAILTYWDGQGNAEIVRLMLAATGEDWEEKVYGEDAKVLTSNAEFMSMVNAGVLGFDQVPLLQIDGLNLVQKYAAVRYLARKHGLYGADNAEATVIDMVYESLMDFQNAVRNKGAETALKKYLPLIQRALHSTPGSYLAGPTLSFVDVVFMYVVHFIKRSAEDPLKGFADLQKHFDTIESIPQIKSYMESSRRYPYPGLEGYFDRVKATIPWAFGDGEPPAMGATEWKWKA